MIAVAFAGLTGVLNVSGDEELDGVKGSVFRVNPAKKSLPPVMLFPGE